MLALYCKHTFPYYGRNLCCMQHHNTCGVQPRFVYENWGSRIVVILMHHQQCLYPASCMAILTPKKACRKGIASRKYRPCRICTARTHFVRQSGAQSQSSSRLYGVCSLHLRSDHTYLPHSSLAPSGVDRYGFCFAQLPIIT